MEINRTDSSSSIKTFSQTDKQKFNTQRIVDEVNQDLKAKGIGNKKQLGQEDFLKLLVTEMTHQDPLNPMTDREFIAQMAQITSLEQMNKLNATSEKMLEGNAVSEAYSLLGKNVHYINIPKAGSEELPTDGKGIVKSVTFNSKDKTVELNIDGKTTILPKDITKVELNDEE